MSLRRQRCVTETIAPGETQIMKTETQAVFASASLLDSHNTCRQKRELIAAASQIPGSAEIEQKYADRQGDAVILLLRTFPQEAIAEGPIPGRKPSLIQKCIG